MKRRRLLPLALFLLAAAPLSAANFVAEVVKVLPEGLLVDYMTPRKEGRGTYHDRSGRLVVLVPVAPGPAIGDKYHVQANDSGTVTVKVEGKEQTLRRYRVVRAKKIP